MANTIVLKGKGHYVEGQLDTVASPGMAVRQAADGDWDIDPSAQAAALKGGLAIVVEDALQGKTVDDAYAIGDKCQIYIPMPGDEIAVLVKAAEDIAFGDLLVTEGGGTGLFVEAAGSETKFQLQAIEATGVSPSGGELCKCRVLAP